MMIQKRMGMGSVRFASACGTQQREANYKGVSQEGVFSFTVQGNRLFSM